MTERTSRNGQSNSGGRRPPGPVTVNRRANEMAWSGIQTFLKLSVCLTLEDLRAGRVDVAVGGAPWDGTATGLTGTHLGPMAIRAYDRQRARGAGHNAALRQLANRLVGILHGCLKTDTLYDETTAWSHHTENAAA